MALVRCTECGKEVSDRAAACPQCGCPNLLREAPEEIPTRGQKKPGGKNFGGTGCLILVAVFVGLMIWFASYDPSSGSRAATAPAALQVPSFRIAVTQDFSYGNATRLNIRVSIPRHYTRSQVEAIARAIVDSVSRQQRVNAITVMFFGPETSITGPWDVASVDWAPGGKWEDADAVRAGDYRTFRYSVSYRPAFKTPSTGESFVPSGKRGLLGAPVPRGASLTSRTPGDVAADRDPSERYRIQAPAAAIVAFYLREMPKLGWLKDGASTDDVLFFTKGRQMLGVLVNRSGGTFTLRGS